MNQTRFLIFLLLGALIAISGRTLSLMSQVEEQQHVIADLQLERDISASFGEALIMLQLAQNAQFERRIKQARIAGQIEILETWLRLAIPEERRQWQEENSWHFENVNGEWVKTPLAEHLMKVEEQRDKSVSQSVPKFEYVKQLHSGAVTPFSLDDAYHKWRPKEFHWRHVIDRKDKYRLPKPAQYVHPSS